ncbi:MAG: hypothetical protein U9O86_08305 [Campylobacterota bacterium]|nr:hypothetical protein [Campylobacterota bacterium]
MTQISISDISKNPSIIDKLDDIAQILNKKTKQVKGVFIPSELLDNFQEVFKELEYKKFVQRNSGIKNSVAEDETLLDGLEDGY